jgi:hypothetical protein
VYLKATNNIWTLLADLLDCQRCCSPYFSLLSVDDTQLGNPNKTPKGGPILYNISQRKVVIRSKLSPVSKYDTLDVAKYFQDLAKYFWDVQSIFEILQSILTILLGDGKVDK